jgi:hypothetical protein
MCDVLPSCLIAAINYREGEGPDDFIAVTEVSPHARLYDGKKFEFRTFERARARVCVCGITAEDMQI